MITLNVNGKAHRVETSEDMPLLWALRDLIGMTGTKFGCGRALCGACTVLVDGQATRSCVTPANIVAGKKITTIEGAADHAVGKRVQAAWRDIDVPQCGYCQPGQIMSATALLSQNKSPSDSEIDDAMSGNVCRCGTYLRIRSAVKKAAAAAGK